MKNSAGTVLVDALRDFRRSWLQLAVADLVARILGFVVVAPLMGLLLKLFLVRTSTGVVTDQAIVGFLLHPFGLFGLLVAISVSLAILLVEVGQLMVIGFGVTEDRYVTWLEALRYVFKRGMALFQLARIAAGRLILIMLPFVLVIGALCMIFLRTYDINYYLAEKPPVFLGVAIASGLLLTVMGLLILTRIADWILALPMALFEEKSGREALRSSAKVPGASRRQLVSWLLVWLAGFGLLFVIVGYLAGILGDILIPRTATHQHLLMAGLVAALAIHGLANLALSVFATALFPLSIVRLYREVAGPGKVSPEIAAAGFLGSKPPWRIPGTPILLAGVALLVGIAVGGTVLLRKLDAGDPDVVIIAHRGGAGVAPENTVAAFTQGIADGADWLELDVQEDADGVVVVGHDRDYMRVAGAKLEVWKGTSSNRADLDIGSFFDPKFSDQRVPTLDSVLEQAKAGKTGLCIELKYYGHDRNLEERVVELVEKTGMTNDVLVMSLEYDGVRKIAGLRPTWTYGLLNAVALGDLTHLDVEFLALTAKTATYATIHRAHRRGMKVYAWTVDDPIQMSVMMSRGVDGIITDRVVLSHHVLDARAKLTPLGRFLVWMAGETRLLHGMETSSSRDDA